MYEGLPRAIDGDLSAAVIREARLADAAILSELGRRTFLQTYVQLMPSFAPLAEAGVRRVFQPAIQAREIRSDQNRYFLAEYSEVAIGYAHLTWGDATAVVSALCLRPMRLNRFYLERVAQGRGVGRRLLAHCEQFSRLRGHDALWLGVWHVNSGALHFYQAHGYRTVGTQAWRTGDYDDCDTVMFKRL
jgi:GNAT superfamily N-acetyltransferase